MPNIERNVLINSSLVRVMAALATTIIHELGHFIVSVSLGNSATLHHNYVETHTENQTLINQLLIAAGGPVISLLQGMICMILYRRIKNGIASLMILWMGISGLMAFFGYMMIAPLFTVGDTGKIFQLLGMPMVWQIVIALGSLILFTLLLLRFNRDFERFIPENILEDKFLRAKWARLLIMYPILIGVVITTLMQFPVVHFLSLLPSLTMPFMLFMVFGQTIMSKNKIEKEKNKDVTYHSIRLIILFVFTMVVYRLLVFGFTLN